jgi:hypothetical protein
LLNHPFITLLGGHPQAISLVAPMLKDTSLKDLFLNFCDSNLMDVVHEKSVLQSQTTSLRVSLDVSITRLRNKNKEALNLFGLIGMLPSGANKEEISQIWGDNSWKPLKDILVRSSLLIHKNNPDDSDIYYMLPFMSERACEIIEEDRKLKQKFHLKCCKVYREYCHEFYSSTKSLEYIEGLASIESNIWACIYRAVERGLNLPHKTSSYDAKSTLTKISDTITLGETSQYSTPKLRDNDNMGHGYLDDLVFSYEAVRSADTMKSQFDDSK